ncbi:MAG: hypothetical protein ACXV3U_04375, partial [Halobacteriota archaeon]
KPENQPITWSESKLRIGTYQIRSMTPFPLLSIACYAYGDIPFAFILTYLATGGEPTTKEAETSA